MDLYKPIMTKNCRVDRLEAIWSFSIIWWAEIGPEARRPTEGARDSDRNKQGFK